MNKIKVRKHKLAYFLYGLVEPIFNPFRLLLAIPRYVVFIKDLMAYSRLRGAERIRFLDILPRIHEKTQITEFDKHYFYQDIWAAKKIYESKASHHIDVASRAIFAGLLTSFTKISFVDIRPLEAKLENFQSIKGDILALPFKDNSVLSLSCLSVAEHIGLGRYGDKLNPFGTKEACQELARVLTPGGNLYFAVPVGKPKLCFNGMRIHSPEQIIKYFNNLKLIELSGIDDEGNFIRNIDINVLSNSNYACGLFWFKKSN